MTFHFFPFFLISKGRIFYGKRRDVKNNMKFVKFLNNYKKMANVPEDREGEGTLVSSCTCPGNI